MIGKGWSSRVGEVANFPVQASWRLIWPLMAQASASRHNATSTLRDWLWRHRFAAWKTCLEEDPQTCRYCGGSKPMPSRAGRLFCSDACRVSAHQASQAGREWPLHRAVREGRSELFVLEQQANDANLWLLDSPEIRVLPPDLASLDNLPPLPDRCASGCAGHPCRWTHDGPCLYSNTAQES